MGSSLALFLKQYQSIPTYQLPFINDMNTFRTAIYSGAIDQPSDNNASGLPTSIQEIVSGYLQKVFLVLLVLFSSSFGRIDDTVFSRIFQAPLALQHIEASQELDDLVFDRNCL